MAELFFVDAVGARGRGTKPRKERSVASALRDRLRPRGDAVERLRTVRRTRHRELPHDGRGYVRAAAEPYQVVGDEAVQQTAQAPLRVERQRLAQAEDRVRADG